MRSWTFVLLYISSQICASSEVNYECGPHGKFEYCIDGILDCVVGCHCHPGYYFDTDTKICEPSMKLTQFRKRFDLEPTHISMINLETASIPTPTTINPINKKIDEITKETDDLGDWLYNQFFKTIENQVINNNDGENPTRKSGSQNMRSNRRESKKNKKSKKKHKKKSLQNKILDIAEDDSLLDSDSSSSSSDETDSFSESVRELSDENGHRKILMINKKPTPPLPSFIFLPNVETPFFPPISLPVPPILPMYPMVPVPPMGVMNAGAGTTTSSCVTLSSIATTVTTVTEAISTTENTTITTSDSETPDTESISDTTESTSEVVMTTSDSETPDTESILDPKKRRSYSNRAALRSQLNENRLNDAKKNMHRNKLMQKFSDNRKINNKRPPIRNLMENFQESEIPYPDEAEQSFELRQRTFDNMPQLGDVNFKYLSQLIHKMDLNKTMPNSQFSPIVNYPTNAAKPLRSNYQSNRPIYINPTYTRPASKADDVNDAFYTDLGKQIASLIRKRDSNGEGQINIEPQQQNPQIQQAVFDENRFSPRSYWERFVRSPLKYLEQFMMSHQKQSNENLINIENQVNMATTAERSLSLQELENIANIMQQTHTTIQKQKNKLTHPNEKKSQMDTNINLVPPVFSRNSPTKSGAKKVNHNIVQTKKKSEMNGNMHNYSFLFQRREEYNKKNHTKIDRKDLTKPFKDIKNKHPLNNILNTRHIASLYQETSDGFHKNVTKPNPLPSEQMKYQTNPILPNYKSINYVSNNRNKYQLQPSYIPFDVPFFSKQKPGGISSNPSYFHDDIQPFDFFD